MADVDLQVTHDDTATQSRKKFEIALMRQIDHVTSRCLNSIMPRTKEKYVENI